jgi:hypothetical protein
MRSVEQPYDVLDFGNRRKWRVLVVAQPDPGQATTLFEDSMGQAKFHVASRS